MDILLQKLQSEHIVALAAILGGSLVGAIAVIMIQWRRIRMADIEASLKQTEAALKQQMLDKGMTPEQIEQVLKSSKDGRAGVSGDESQNRAALVQRMVDEGYEGADIERVLKAYEPAKAAEPKTPASSV